MARSARHRRAPEEGPRAAVAERARRRPAAPGRAHAPPGQARDQGAQVRGQRVDPQLQLPRTEPVGVQRGV